MTYSLNYRWGDSADGDVFSEDELTELLAQLDGQEDPEHGDFSVCDNESGAIVSVFSGDRGLIVLEDEDDAFHMTGITRPEALRIIVEFTRGELANIRRVEPWLPGYG